jgi:hypothetical protein
MYCRRTGCDRGIAPSPARPMSSSPPFTPPREADAVSEPQTAAVAAALASLPSPGGRLPVVPTSPGSVTVHPAQGPGPHQPTWRDQAIESAYRPGNTAPAVLDDDDALLCYLPGPAARKDAGSSAPSDSSRADEQDCVTFHCATQVCTASCAKQQQQQQQQQQQRSPSAAPTAPPVVAVHPAPPSAARAAAVPALFPGCGDTTRMRQQISALSCELQRSEHARLAFQQELAQTREDRDRSEQSNVDLRLRMEALRQQCLLLQAQLQGVMESRAGHGQSHCSPGLKEMRGEALQRAHDDIEHFVRQRTTLAQVVRQLQSELAAMRRVENSEVATLQEEVER